MNSLPYYGSLAASILLGVCAQLTLKTGAERSGESLLSQFMSPFTVGGLGIYAAAFVFYIIAIRRIPLSLAFPMVATSYVVVAIAAHYLWGENFGWYQFAGLVFIAGGIVLLHQG